MGFGCRTAAPCAAAFTGAALSTGLSGKFSLQYTLARALYQASK
jgi:hypothetical protein